LYFVALTVELHVVIVMDFNCSFLVDPSRVTGEDGLMLEKAQVDSVCALGKTAVLQLAQEVLDAVCAKESLDALPHRMARIARRTFECARDRGVEDPLAVAGGKIDLV
jgi:hypothetical protein